MDCRQARDLISASIDGEAHDLERQGAEAHVRTCDACQAYSTALGGLPGGGGPRSATRGGSEQLRVLLRLAIATVALVELGRSLPSLLAHLGGDHSALVSNHLGAWNLAFAIGMLVVAIQPFRVRGLLPMVAAITGVMALTLVLDMVGGHPSEMAPGSHFIELCGLVLLWCLERVQYPSPHGFTLRLRQRPRPAG